MLPVLGSDPQPKGKRGGTTYNGYEVCGGPENCCVNNSSTSYSTSNWDESTAPEALCAMLVAGTN
jgi:hypothetical protein